MRSVGRTTRRGRRGERNNEEDEESTGIIRARISLEKTENEDGRRAWWSEMFVGNFIISRRQKATGTQRVPLNKRSSASSGLGLLKPRGSRKLIMRALHATF